MIKQIQKWILSRDFIVRHHNEYFEERKENIYRKAFADALKDFKETSTDDVDKKAEELSKKKLNELLSVVDANNIVTLDKQRGIIFIGGIKADDGRLSNLKAEADFLLQTDLWRLLYETPKELAQRSMFVSGETLADMAKGKSMLYTLSTQKNIVDIFKGYVGKSPIVVPPKP